MSAASPPPLPLPQLLVGGAPAAPSDWVVRWAPLLPAGAAVLDVACGHGRHVQWLARAGHRLTAIDREAALLAPLAGLGRVVVADLESAPWPLADERFDVVLVTNYLWRPLFPALLAAVAPGGLLIYETFSSAQAAIGRPRRAEFLLNPGELLGIVREADAPVAPDTPAMPAPRHWQVIAYEDGHLPARGDVPERAVQRLVARRLPAPSGGRDPLAAPG